MSKKTYQLVFKILIVAALFYFLFSKGFISLKDTKKALTDWGQFGSCARLNFCQRVFGGYSMAVAALIERDPYVLS